MKAHLRLSAAVLISACVLLPSFAYDIHTKALTPITEDPAPAGAPVELVKDGELEFALVNDRCDGWRRDLEVITNAFVRTTGKMPAVYKSAESNEYLKAKSLILLGDRPYVRWRGEPYFFYETFENEKLVKHYEPYMGRIPLRDTKFAVYFRGARWAASATRATCTTATGASTSCSGATTAVRRRLTQCSNGSSPRRRGSTSEGIRGRPHRPDARSRSPLPSCRNSERSPPDAG